MRHTLASPLASGISRHRFKIGEQRETKLGEIDGRARERFPFYFLLPWDNPIELLKWRIYVRERCISDLKFRAQIWEMARLDVAFFIVTFCVIFEPRPTPRWLPFFLWTDQVSILAWLEEISGVRHIGISKTRGIGISYLTTAEELHDWLFIPGVSIAVTTKDKTTLISKDANSLMGKFQYMYDHLPAWAKVTRNGAPLLERFEGEYSFINQEHGAVYQGFVSTSTKMRGLRFTKVKGDEFAFYDRTDQDEWLVSAGGTTDCIVYVSTWNDFGDCFHRLMYEEESSLLRVHAYWWNNSERYMGAYKMNYGRPELVDKDYRHPHDYQFGLPDVIPEGTLRSPWVDSELSKPGTNRLKSIRDLYGMMLAAPESCFFSQEMQDAVKESCKTPEAQGQLDTTTGKVKILPTTRSDIRTWGGVPHKNRGPYTAFCDLSQGVGRDFSVMQVVDAGGEQVLEYGTNELQIEDFARNVVLIARWLCGDEGDGYCLIDMEANGQQIRPFRNELLRLGYGYIHTTKFKSKGPGRNSSDATEYLGTKNGDHGWQNLRELDRAVLAMDILVRSDRVLAELPIFGKEEDKGHPTFPKAHKLGHGDFTQALGGAWFRARATVSTEERARIEGGDRELEAVGMIYQPANLWSDGYD